MIRTVGLVDCLAHAPLQTELHQIGVERRNGALERAGQRLHGPKSGLRHVFSRLGILEPGADPHRQLAGVRNHLGAASGVERRIDLGEIPDMRAVNDGRA